MQNEASVLPKDPIVVSEADYDKQLVNPDLVEGRYFEVPVRDVMTKQVYWRRFTGPELWNLLVDGRK